MQEIFRELSIKIPANESSLMITSEYQEFLSDGKGNPDGRIRNDLMEELTTVNKEMTDLLKKKVNHETDGEFNDCERAQLDVLGKIK